MASSRVYRATDDLAREIVSRVVRWGLLVLGFAILAVGLVLSFLPLHLGLPLLVVGLMIVLQNSFKARRRFVTIQRRHPNVVFPIRRLLRRDPEIVPVAWQQVLRVERLILPARYRFFGSVRRRLRGRG